jgi:hypothetical protein
VRKQPADDLAGRIESRDDAAVQVLDLGLCEIFRPPNVKVTPVVTC